MDREFDELVAEAEAVSVEGWDFDWLEGRATEERPSWGYARLMAGRMGMAGAALDIATGGGEVLASVPILPTLTVATESWPPNVARATALLRPRGVAVVAVPDEPPLPFADDTFDLVVCRHPVTAYFGDIARLLQPGGTYFAQHVGPDSAFEVSDFFLGPLTRGDSGREPELARREAEAAGLEVVDLRSERLRMEFFDVGSMIYFLRKVIWIVPGFTVDEHRQKLRELHERIRAEGPFVSYSARFLIEAHKPAT
ncbi:MAG TPA: methyltransferase domain-containing protein [Micromonosporaceae bacterium]|nr:methyltransferase domain-containing protein [Micromonosporaceae bacterium]